MDVFAALTRYLAAFDGVRAVYDDVPHNAIPKYLPLVHLESAGPARRAPALQGLGVDQVGVDINLVIPESMWRSGAGVELAQRLRVYLSQFRDGHMRAVEVTRPEKWPDRNPKTRRLGMTVEVLIPAQL